MGRPRESDPLERGATGSSDLGQVASAGPSKYPAPVQFSPDGEWFWDGVRWQPAYSPDRRLRWDGARWLPTGPAQMQQWRYEPTEWTRRLQVILLALLVVGGVTGVVLVPAFMLPTMQRIVDTTLATMPPSSGVDPVAFRDSMNSIFITSLVAGGVIGVVALGVVIAGIVRLWRWVYWYLVVSFLIAPLGLLQNTVTYFFGSGPVQIPGWLLLYSVPLVAIETALGIWMIMLYRQSGTWARRRIPV